MLETKLPELVDNVKRKMIQVFAKVPIVGTTLDRWTDRRKRGFIAVTAQICDDGFSIVSLLLGMKRLKGKSDRSSINCNNSILKII